MSSHAADAEESWVLPDRRTELRNGADPRSAHEAFFQATYREHQEDRRAADARRS